METSSTELDHVKAWINQGFIKDHMSLQMQRIQGRDFLRTGAEPVIGQRVELSLNLKGRSTPGKASFCRLSGQVVQLLPAPVTIRPRALHDTDPKLASSLLNDLLGDPSYTFRGDYPMGSVAVPCECPRNCNTVKLYMPPDLWEVQDAEIKAEARHILHCSYGAIHGQEIICEGRLHFDYDSRRGSEEGPWGDGIPFDGRDVWRFKLYFDDDMECMWNLDIDSLENLGRKLHPRCWPWSNEMVLPYHRCGHDRFEVYAHPEGTVNFTMCVGPFGCDGGNTIPHSHNEFVNGAGAA